MVVHMASTPGLPRPSLLFPDLTSACPVPWHAAWGSTGESCLGAAVKLAPWQLLREP